MARQGSPGRWPDRDRSRWLAGRALGARRGRCRHLDRGARSGAPIVATARDLDDRGDDLPRAARPGQCPQASRDAVRLRLHLGGVHAGAEAQVRATTHSPSCGATGSSRGSTDGSSDRPPLFADPRPLARGSHTRVRPGLRRGVRLRNPADVPLPRCRASRRHGRATAPAPRTTEGDATVSAPRSAADDGFGNLLRDPSPIAR